MATITQIKQQKDKDRVNIYLDGKFGFGIDLVNFVKLNLRVEQELSQDDIDKIVSTSEHQKTLDKLLYFVSIRPRSREEIKIWMRRKLVPEDMRSTLTDTLTRMGFLNDYEFAKWWVEQRVSFKPKGKKALKFELLKKGIDRKVIDNILEELEIDDEKVAFRLVQKKKETWKRFDNETRKKKMTEYLARQGFGWELIKKILISAYPEE